MKALIVLLVAGVGTFGVASTPAAALDLIGADAFGGWTEDAPGVRRLIRPSDLPPTSSDSIADPPTVVPRPAGAMLSVPEGFKVELFADGLDRPRVVRVAPNGDIFVSEGIAGQIRVLRPNSTDSGVETVAMYAAGLNRPFGLAFYPRGLNPTHLYVAENNRVIRFPYNNGDLVARGVPKVLTLQLPSGGVSGLPAGGHWTRDVVFGPRSQRMFISIGSATNAAEMMREETPEFIAQHEAKYGRGASWGNETNRAVVLAASPKGRNAFSFATGLRNCTAMAVHPLSGRLWCANTERDRLGDNLVPDFVTPVANGGFYGWPWYYIGKFEDPRQAGERPDLAPYVLTPDVLIQAHSSPLGITFYDGTQFPEKYRNNAFVTLRGSWNRAERTGYKVVRIVTDSRGRPDGWYEDFLTGFVANNEEVWGRPVGIAVARDGSLLVSEDGNGTIWRISYQP